jgi:TolB-like protein/class 3 adenylate cyclase/Tfp pilus assembly protein PilF
MAEQRVERRLAAILAGDVAGYSRLMGADEEGTLARLNAHRREFLEPKVAEYRGRIVKRTGDGVLIEFGSAVDAARYAVEIQHGMAERNASTPQDKRIELRIGIHIGDIITEEGDIFGDGVNIAARLEALAQPGGVCISDDAYRQVRGKLDVNFDDIGEQQLKNIAQRVRVYQLRYGGRVSSAPLALPDKPSIAVLPFQNMSGHPEQDYFADGIVEEIITALSRFRQLFVIARNSSFTYKGRAADVKEVGRELGVRYVLEGSVRRASDRVRITAQLIDAQTGGHLWAERFDGTPEDIFDLQDQVTARVVGAIIPTLEQVEFNRTKSKPTESLDAYDYYLRAMTYFNQWTNESIDEALKLLNKAIELDHEFASAHGLAAWCYTRRRQSRWMKDHPHEMAELERLARRAIALANDDAVALYTGGWALVHVAGSVEEGAAAINRALTLNPNMTNAWHLSGWTNIYIGDPDKAVEHFARAMRLNPLDPIFHRMQIGTIAALLLAGRYEQSALVTQAAVQQHPTFLPLLRVAVASYALAGKMTEAKETVARVRQLDPTSPLSRAVDFAPFRRPEDISRYRDALQKAGLSD